jgi:hypothetical protein
MLRILVCSNTIAETSSLLAKLLNRTHDLFMTNDINIKLYLRTIANYPIPIYNAHPPSIVQNAI